MRATMTNTPHPGDVSDVAIIGSGPAGLSAALTLSRAGKTSVVYDAGQPRNARSSAAHGFLSRDDTPPGQLRVIARRELGRYGLTRFRNQRVAAIETTDDSHTIVTAMGALRVRFVILAVGVLDDLPDITGLWEHWGGDVIHCPFCQGWERRGTPWALLALGDEDVRSAPRMLGWTDELTLLTGRLDRSGTRSLASVGAHGVRVDSRPVEEIAAGRPSDGVVIRFAFGEPLFVGALVVRPHQRQTSLVRSLDLELTTGGRHVWTDEKGETSRPRIYVVGDLAGGHQGVLPAAASGMVTAQGVSHRLTLDSLARGESPYSAHAPEGWSPRSGAA